jgi:hypothetical protein
LAQASMDIADSPTASARLLANAVDRNTAARAERVTAILCGGESFTSLKPQVYLIEYVDKILKMRRGWGVCAITTAKSRPRRFRARR